MTASSLLPSLLILFLAASCQANPGGVIVQEFFEQRCSPESGFVTQNFDNWIGNLTEGTALYFPLLSSLDVLRITQDLFKESDLSFLSHEDVLNSCITVRAAGAGLTFHGYCQETASKQLIPVAPKVLKWNKIFPAGVGGLFRISLSDNKSWQIVDVCWGDGQRSFAVISLYPYLSACTRRVIVEHLKAIGFNEKYFTGLTYDYDTCHQACRRYESGAALGQRDEAVGGTGIPLLPYGYAY